RLAVDALRPLLDKLFNGPDSVRQETIRIVGVLGLKEAGPRLFGLLADEKEPSIRVEALKTLGVLKDERLNEALKRALADSDPQLRIEGRRMLATLRPAECLAELAGALQTGSLVEQQSALALLADLNMPEADRLILEWMDKLLARQVPPELQLHILEAAAPRRTPALPAK